jgi:hypothetical protein
MSKTPIRPRSDMRRARRSLVELTASASCAIDDSSLVMMANPIAAYPDDPAFPAANTHERTTIAGQRTAPSSLAVSGSREATACTVELAGFDSSAEMVVKIAKQCHNKALENIRLAVDATLDHAKDVAETRVGREDALQGHAGANRAAAGFQDDALQMMAANVITSLKYAQELAGTRTAAEFVQLSSTQARKQCELMLKQAGSLTSFMQTITKSIAD